ncbi:MAG: hypothetical protein M0C28_47905 [Candidatus Moduliflexus flocculans]|nr:hypothetical protein [Candidatus Moduliflexus flocculans]
MTGARLRAVAGPGCFRRLDLAAVSCLIAAEICFDRHPERLDTASRGFGRGRRSGPRRMRARVLLAPGEACLAGGLILIVLAIDSGLSLRRATPIMDERAARSGPC